MNNELFADDSVVDSHVLIDILNNMNNWVKDDNILYTKTEIFKTSSKDSIINSEYLNLVGITTTQI